MPDRTTGVIFDADGKAAVIAPPAEGTQIDNYALARKNDITLRLDELTQRGVDADDDGAETATRGNSRRRRTTASPPIDGRLWEIGHHQRS